MTVAASPEAFFADHGKLLLWMAFVEVILRPLLFGSHAVLINQVIVANVTGLIRWQTHRYLLRKGLSFFNMEGKTVNAIPTITAMDRLVVMDHGWIVA